MGTRREQGLTRRPLLWGTVTRLTEIEREFGIDATRACAGHTTPDTTSIYVQRDQSVAIEVMGRVG